jgi:hypothetical protein
MPAEIANILKLTELSIANNRSFKERTNLRFGSSGHRVITDIGTVGGEIMAQSELFRGAGAVNDGGDRLLYGKDRGNRWTP